MKNFYRNLFLALGVFVVLLVATAGISRLGIFDKSQNGLTKKALAQENSRIVITGGGESGRYNGAGVIPLANTEEPFVNVSCYNVFGPGQASVYEANEDTLLKFLVHDKDNNQLDSKIDFDRLQLIDSMPEDCDTNIRVSLPRGKSGIFVVNFRSGTVENSALVIVSSFAVATREGDNQLLFWAQNFDNKRSATEVAITTYDLNQGVRKLDRATTNADGLTQLPISEKADVALAEKNGSLALVPINLTYLNSDHRYNQFAYRQPEMKGFLFTDRSLYKPGDKLNFKAILRNDRDADYSIPTGQMNVKVTNGGYEEDEVIIFEQGYQISPEGSIDGEVNLPETMTPGEYYLKAEKVGVQEEDNSFGFWDPDDLNAAFSVEHYQKPEYQVEVEAKKIENVKGDQVVFELKGSYFSGYALANKQVKYQLRGEDFYTPYRWDSESGLDQPGRLWSGKLVQDGELGLDKEGRAQLVFDSGKLSGDRDQVLTLSVSYQDESGQPAGGRKSVLVYQGEYEITGKGYSSVKVNESVDFKLKLISHQGTAGDLGGQKLTANVHLRDWSWRAGNYEKYEKDLQPMEVVTNEAGEAVLHFTPERRGSYDIKVTGEDGRGNVIKEELYLWVVDEKGDFYRGFRENEQIVVTADKEKYQPGEVAHLTVVSKTTDRDVWLTTERGFVKTQRVVRLNRNTGQIKVPLSDKDMPNIFVSAVSFGDGGLDTGRAEMKVDAASKKLQVELKPNAISYGPGEPVELEVITKDSNGQGVAAEVAVWAVDKSLFQLMKSKTGDIFRRFWGKRYNETGTSNSLRQIGALQAEMGGCFAVGTEITLADGQRRAIEKMKAGDEILTLNQRKQPVRAKVASTHKATVYGHLTINGNLKITPNHVLQVNGLWQPAGNIQIGDHLIDQTGNEVAVESVEWQRGKFEVYNLEIAQWHTFLANGFWVHNDKEGGERSDFKDVAYWNPKVKTDAEGKAKVYFNLPDDLTTWAISGTASTADTRVGEGKSEIKTAKEVVMRPILPNFLRAGDELWLSALVHNFTDKDYQFQASLEFDAGKVKDFKQKISVPANQSKQVFWEVAPDQVKENAKLTYRVEAKNDKQIGDGVQVELPVKRFGLTEKRRIFGEQDGSFEIKFLPETKREESKVEVAVSSTLIGSLAPGVKYLINYPYGCMEQTTSRFMPVVIAKENPTLFEEVIKNKDLDEMIKAGIKRLASHQKNDGGWAWFYGVESDYFISAYVFEYALRAQRSGVDFHDGLILKASNFFKKEIQNPDKEKEVMRQYGLSLLKEEVGKKELTDFADLSDDFLAYAVMANINHGYTNPATNGMNELMKRAVVNQDMVYWNAGKEQNFGSEKVSTALALRALIAGGADLEEVEGVVRYLAQDFKGGLSSGSTFETAQKTQALTEFVKKYQEEAVNCSFSLELDGELIAQDKISHDSPLKTITIPGSKVKSDGSRLAVQRDCQERIYLTLTAEEFSDDKKMKARNGGIAVERKYVNTKGRQYPIAVGDTVDVELIVETDSGGREDYLVVEDVLPSGMVPVNPKFINEQFAREQHRSSYFGLSNLEMTKDGMRVYARNWSNAGKHSFSYQARVVAAGKFIVPPAKALLMYKPTINGRSAADEVEISRVPVYVPDLGSDEKGTDGRVGVDLMDRKKIFSGLVSLVLLLALIGGGVYWLRRQTAKKLAKQDDSKGKQEEKGTSKSQEATSGQAEKSDLSKKVEDDNKQEQEK